MKELLKELDNQKDPYKRNLFINEYYQKNSDNLDLKNKLKKLVKKNLKELFSKGENYGGVLEQELLTQDPKLRTLRSKWARKKGRNFEKNVVEYFNNKESYAQINPFRYQNQLYDIIVFLKDRSPLVIQCKSQGVKFKKGQLKLMGNSRRFVNYLKNKEKIKLLSEFVSFYFAFGSEEGFYMIKEVELRELDLSKVNKINNFFYFSYEKLNEVYKYL